MESMLSITTPQVILTCVGAVAIYICYVIVHAIYLHPLAAFKGPLLAKFSPYYMVSWEVNSNRVLGSYDLLQKFGSPVRISPNELMYADEKSYIEIYGQSAQFCLKDPMFDNFTVTGATHLLNARDRRRHAGIRRLLNPGLSKTGVTKFEPYIAQRVEKFVRDTFGKSAETGEAVDIHHDTRSLFLDIVSYLSFGKTFDAVDGQQMEVSKAINAFALVVPLSAMVPLLRWFPSPSFQAALRTVRNFEIFTRNLVVEYAKTCRESMEKQDQTKPQWLLHDLVTSVDAETGRRASVDELVENAMIFIVAGTDTSAISIYSVLWELGKRPDAQRKLVHEIRTAFPNPEVMPTYKDVSALTYLQAVIEETLRLRGPLSTARSTRVSPGKVLGQSFVPAGVIVSTNMYAASRDPDAFPDPESFMPERWLQQTTSMRNLSRPFSFGPRNCIGKHLAEMGITLTIARIFQLYDVTIDGSMTEEMMKIKDIGVLAPQGGKLVIRAKSATQHI